MKMALTDIVGYDVETGGNYFNKEEGGKEEEECKEELAALPRVYDDDSLLSAS